VTTTTEAATQGAVEHAAKGPIDPIHQFQIDRIIPIHIGPIDASLTNSGLWAIIAVCVVSLIFLMAPRDLVPRRLQSLAESIYEFVDNMTHEVLGHHSRDYFPFVLTLFTFILACNVLGLIPYAFTVTSHIVVTLALALTVFIGATIIGFARNGARYLKIFVPSGVPPLILIILVPIEIISYFIRPFSLSIRLFANMMAGHMMLKVAAGFVIMLGAFAGWFPLIATVALYALELLVAVLQAYVFALLTCLYLSDALHVDH
jgi:F-type H+-transporting ATPase subunit a